MLLYAEFLPEKAKVDFNKPRKKIGIAAVGGPLHTPQSKVGPAPVLLAPPFSTNATGLTDLGNDKSHGKGREGNWRATVDRYGIAEEVRNFARLRINC